MIEKKKNKTKIEYSIRTQKMMPFILKKTLFFALIFTLGIFNAINAQSIDVLKDKIQKVISNKKATVAIAMQGMHAKDRLSINGDKHLPMQSIYKYHLALAVLDQVDRGKLALEQLISIDKQRVDAYKHLWSPLRKKYPNGAIISLSEILKYTVSWSDNLGCDLLFEIIGGPDALQSYLKKNGIRDISIVHTEIEMQAKWERQFENWTTAKAANQALQLFFENNPKILSPESHDFLLNVLIGTKTGKKSIRGLLPKETIIAHKTGHSGKNKKGVTGAVNDIGIVFLPDNSYFYLSILVSDSLESDQTNQRIIAEVAKLSWDYFKSK